MSLKPISAEAIPRALELAERYRLLNEPEQAASICHDVLGADPGNHAATRILLLATTDQFGRKPGATIEDAESVVATMGDPYERAYYGGVACERWARAKLDVGTMRPWVGEWLRKAMGRYEQAESLRAPGNDDALLRWNACSRLIDRMPELAAEPETAPLHGD